MCVICIAGKGTDKNSEFFLQALKTGLSANGDGAGYAFKRASTNKVFVAKGFTKYQELIDSINKRKLTNSDELIVHFRIGNKGAKNVDMMHPFVASTEPDEILANHKYVEYPVLFHNGTLMDFSGDHNSKVSDTYRFTRLFLSNKDIQNILIKDEEEFADLFEFTLKTNRLAILFPGINKQIAKIGKFVEDKGYYFSNDSYKDKNIRNVGGTTSYLGSSNVNNWNLNWGRGEFNEGDDYYEDVRLANNPDRLRSNCSIVPINNKGINKDGIAILARGFSEDHKIYDNKNHFTYIRIGGFYFPEVLENVHTNQFDAAKIVINQYNYTDLVFTVRVGWTGNYSVNNSYKIIYFNPESNYHTLGKILNGVVCISAMEGTIQVSIDDLYSDFSVRPESQYEDKYLDYYAYLSKNPISKSSNKKLITFLNTVTGKKDVIKNYKGLDSISRDSLLFIATQNLMYFCKDDIEEVECKLINKCLV